MRKYAIIVAGGSGTRFGGNLPKQFLPLEGKPVLWWSMRAFREADSTTELILVLPESGFDLWQSLFAQLPSECQYPHKLAKGGTTRSESVVNGLALVETEEDSYVAIHDGARPLITPEVINRGWEAALQHGNGVAAVPVTDSLRRVAAGRNEAVDRSEFMAIQTPQIFKSRPLMLGYEQAGRKSFTDDASVMENYGHKITLYDGSPLNIKITNPGDLEIAQTIIKRLYAEIP